MRLTCKLLVLAAALSLTACGSGNNGTNNGATNNGATNNGDADAGNNGGGADVDNSSAEYAAEYETIFDTLVFANRPASALNSLVDNNLDQSLEFPIIVLLEVSEFDLDAGTLQLRGGSGLKTETDGVYVWDDTSESIAYPGTINAATGAFQADLPFFGFVATFKFENDVSKVTLPINNLDISGKLALADGGATATVVDGYMEGILTKEDGDTTFITLTPGGEPISITQLFKTSSLNYDTATSSEVEAGTGDAWFIAGDYTAVSTDIDD